MASWWQGASPCTLHMGRPLATMMPLRGPAHKGPIRPIKSDFPKTSERTMGPHGWMRGSYSILSLTNPIVGPMYRPPWVVGGIHNPTIDPDVHFNMQDRFQTVSFLEMTKCFLWCLMPARVQIIMVGLPIVLASIIAFIEQRREPMEIFMDREEYFKDFSSYYYGVYFDHHHFSHMLCHRRANKWGYAGLDITLEEEEHGGHDAHGGGEHGGGHGAHHE
eukprot:NODE_3670_length_757_cov_303.413105.p1 GENE.NODE_3670_length_757_cov_303.413105~~NODE_3670_length_757_cov_303.413105.p1  ORF type:complete len:219 (-),score=64.30 NODE_3670_length_757_cov_303.413105:83-739(-)